jgi:hypothetical protein
MKHVLCKRFFSVLFEKKREKDTSIKVDMFLLLPLAFCSQDAFTRATKWLRNTWVDILNPILIFQRVFELFLLKNRFENDDRFRTDFLQKLTESKVSMKCVIRVIINARLEVFFATYRFIMNNR